MRSHTARDRYLSRVGRLRDHQRSRTGHRRSDTSAKAELSVASVPDQRQGARIAGRYKHAQDLSFVVERADMTLGSVSGTKNR